MRDADRSVLYHWTLSDLGRAGDPGGPFRAAETLMVRHIAPALRDPRVREHASSVHLRRWHETDDHGVSFIMAAPTDAAEILTTAVASHLASSGLWRHGVADANPLLHPAFRDYLRGLGEVTAIALDLACAAEPPLQAHQCVLIRLCCAPADPRFELHPYLMQHSPAYVRYGAIHQSCGAWPWEHEEFWARCYTRGPALEFEAPLASLWNIVLGIRPRRRDDPRALASRIGIACS